MWVHTTGSDGRDVRVGYDGKTVTVVGDRQKVYASVKAPATLDETLDYISERFDLRVGVADFLYSSPYDSFAGCGGAGRVGQTHDRRRQVVRGGLLHGESRRRHAVDDRHGAGAAL